MTPDVLSDTGDHRLNWGITGAIKGRTVTTVVTAAARRVLQWYLVRTEIGREMTEMTGCDCSGHQILKSYYLFLFSLSFFLGHFLSPILSISFVYLLIIWCMHINVYLGGYIVVYLLRFRIRI